ncbi:MAG: dihydroorotate dehydrogenase electron transfer subunit [Treponema sp.]|jgi:NAD(P)H-flavin reductase|nr:dihydroorotate dehydrogenase electron transfer subunit [Treponema sp.]
MIPPSAVKQSLSSVLLDNEPVNSEIFRLDFEWEGNAPRAGQFFMIKPERTSVFLGRPVSAASWTIAKGKKSAAGFLVARRGRGTEELAGMRPGEKAELTGPLGNAWADFLPPPDGRKIALVGGGVGVAPLEAFAAELAGRGDNRGNRCGFDFYAGFKTGPGKEERRGILGPALFPNGELIVAAEDGGGGCLRGRIPDFLDPAKYGAVYACGPEAMLKTAAAKCAALKVPCFIGMERRMACGVGACLGCTIKTTDGNRRCCADGPVFEAERIIFDE